MKIINCNRFRQIAGVKSPNYECKTTLPNYFFSSLKHIKLQFDEHDQNNSF